jgi:hypothetical protein
MIRLFEKFAVKLRSQKEQRYQTDLDIFLPLDLDEENRLFFLIFSKYSKFRLFVICLLGLFLKTAFFQNLDFFSLVKILT